MADRQTTESVLKEFADRRTTLELLCAKTKALIEQCLDDAGVRYQSVQARVKTEKKLKSKYEDPTKGYAKLDDITDQAGLRVITYYEEEVDKVAVVIGHQFEVRKDKSVDKRKTEPDRFGYYALHFVCLHLKRRIEDVEYKKFNGLCFEIQITPILQHAWAEIEHEWYDLKEAFPEDIKRRFSRISAVLEVAGSEFSELRRKRDNYTKSIELQVETNVSNIPLDAISFRSLLAESWLSEADVEVAAAFGRSKAEQQEGPSNFTLQALKTLGVATVEQVRTLLDRHRASLKAFVTEYRTLPTDKAPTDVFPRGISLFYLVVMLLASRGEPEFSKALGQLKASVGSWGPTTIVEMANRAMSQSGQQ
jgi:putative GTP pyrophosphokinase